MPNTRLFGKKMRLPRMEHRVEDSRHAPFKPALIDHWTNAMLTSVIDIGITEAASSERQPIEPVLSVRVEPSGTTLELAVTMVEQNEGLAWRAAHGFNDFRTQADRAIRLSFDKLAVEDWCVVQADESGVRILGL